MLFRRRPTKSYMSWENLDFVLIETTKILCVAVSLLHVDSCLDMEHTPHSTQPLPSEGGRKCSWSCVHWNSHIESHAKTSRLVECWTSLYTSEEIHEKNVGLFCGLCIKLETL